MLALQSHNLLSLVTMCPRQVDDIRRRKEQKARPTLAYYYRANMSSQPHINTSSQPRANISSQPRKITTLTQAQELRERKRKKVALTDNT